MNDFNTKLNKARAKQSLLYVYLFIVLAAIGLGVVGTIIFTNGTAIKINPEEAAQSSVIRVTKGLGLSIADAVYAIGEEPTIEVSAEGYRTEERLVTFQEKGGTINITLRPLPGRLIATTSPAGVQTRWAIDEDAVAIAERLDIELDDGDYRLAVNNPYFAPETKVVSIVRGKERQVSFTLEPIMGYLSISTIPEKTKVRIDDGEPQAAPLALQTTGGTYRITVTHPDYISATDTIELTNSAPDVARTYRLKRKLAELRFDMKPSGGELLVDGVRVDPTGPATITSKVEHQLTYIKPGYYPITRTVTLNPDEKRTIAFNLKPEFGEVEVRASPQATVLVNGRRVGTTPLSLDLPAIPQNISLTRPGYRSVTRSLTPKDGSTALVDVTLQTELEARLASAPKTYTNGAGISLKLFDPGAFTMGAPRHELGQRANEFVRNVRLRKHFYAALHEVTQEQYAKFSNQPPGPGLNNIPVTSISWIEAVKYCNWLSAQEGLSPFYSLSKDTLVSVNAKSDGYRLLTEAEWEWLARSAGRDQQTIFPWGDASVVPPMTGNIADESAQGLSDFFVPNYNDGYAEVAPVGSYASEPSGLFDLVGNVSEWVHDYYSLMPPKAGAIETDPLGAEYGESHVIKGSNWRSGTRTELRAAYREGLMVGRDDLGFRVGRYLYGGAENAETQQ